MHDESVHGAIEIFETPYGRFATDTVADAKMADVFRHGLHHQEDTINILSACMTPQSVVVDAGAHIGTIALPLAKRSARVVAYEPDEHTFALLQKNSALNEAQIDVRRKGLGVRASYGTVVPVRAGNAGAHTLAVGEGSVEIVALDEDLPTFDVLKIDVEGMELSVLRGAERIIREARPVIFFEVNVSQLHVHGTTLAELGAFFRARDYQLFLPFRLSGVLHLGTIASLPLAALCIMPGALLLGRTSSTFDVLALPSRMAPPFPLRTTFFTLAWLILRNIRNKKERIQGFFESIF